jgi:hypothetical protein
MHARAAGSFLPNIDSEAQAPRWLPLRQSPGSPVTWELARRD